MVSELSFGLRPRRKRRISRISRSTMLSNPLATRVFLILYLSFLLPLSSAVPAVVTIFDLASWSFRGDVASYGRRLDEDSAYISNLMVPPDDPRLCGFPSSLLDENNETIQVEIRTPIALLISLGGGCDPIDKVNVALKMQREVSGAIRYLVFYNNDPDDPDDIPSLRESDFYKTDEDYSTVAIVSVSTSAGAAILGRIEQLKDLSGASPNFLTGRYNHRWQLSMSLALINDQYYPRGYATTRTTSANFYWFRFVLFTLLIISPCCRAGYLWWAGGGRIRFRRNENGRIVGFQYIPPMTYWFATNGAHEGVPPISDRLTEEEVLALPEITYKGPKDDDDKCGDDGGDQSTAENNSTDSDDAEEVDIVVSAGSDDAGQEANTKQVDGPAEEDPSNNTNANANNTNCKKNLNADNHAYSTTCTTCSICIDEFEEGERIRLLPRCNHAFHTDCIMPWLTERQGCCPLCKTSVIESENEDNRDGNYSSRSSSSRSSSSSTSIPNNGLGNEARGAEAPLESAPSTLEMMASEESIQSLNAPSSPPPTSQSERNEPASSGETLSANDGETESTESAETSTAVNETNIISTSHKTTSADSSVTRTRGLASLTEDPDITCASSELNPRQENGIGNVAILQIEDTTIAPEDAGNLCGDEDTLSVDCRGDEGNPISGDCSQTTSLTEKSNFHMIPHDNSTDDEVYIENSFDEELSTKDTETEENDDESVTLESPVINKRRVDEFPFDEHPHDESDPSLMDVPFDEQSREPWENDHSNTVLGARTMESSESIWLKAVGDRESSSVDSISKRDSYSINSLSS